MFYLFCSLLLVLKDFQKAAGTFVPGREVQAQSFAAPAHRAFGTRWTSKTCAMRGASTARWTSAAAAAAAAAAAEMKSHVVWCV